MASDAAPRKSLFMSHSFDDAPVVALLCEMLVRHTSGAVTIFSASDGQSIRLGRDWVSELERGLVESQLSLLIITPSSEGSAWITFEAGVAFAHGRRVVPVGCFGGDVERLVAPVGLLQGFNVSDEKGLNNLIVLINEEFGCTFPPAFTAEEYASLERVARSDRLRAFDAALEMLDSIRLHLDRDDCPTLLSSPEDVAEICRSTLADAGLDVSVQLRDGVPDALASRGLRIDLQHEDGKTKTVELEMHPRAFRHVYPAVVECAKRLTEESLARGRLACQCVKGTTAIQSHHHILALLFTDKAFRLGKERVEVDGVELWTWRGNGDAGVGFDSRDGALDAAWVEEKLVTLITRGVVRRFSAREAEDAQYADRMRQQEVKEFHREARLRAEEAMRSRGSGRSPT